MNIVIICDYSAVRKGLRYLLEENKNITICGEAEDINSGIDIISATNAELTVLDIEPKNGVYEIIDFSRIKKAHPEIKILATSMFEDTVFVNRILEYGADGYISKGNIAENILTAIDEIINGNIYVNKSIGENARNK